MREFSASRRRRITSATRRRDVAHSIEVATRECVIRPHSSYAEEICGLVAVARCDLETGIRNLSVAREVTRRYKSGFAEIILCAVDLFWGRPHLVRLVFDNEPGDCPQNPWCVFQLMAGLAEGDREHVLRAVAFAERLPPDPLIGMCNFLGHAVRGAAVDSMGTLTPEVEAVLWQDLQNTECVAAGFSLLGDGENIVKWLGRSVDLGMGYCTLTVHQHATWLPWLNHPRIAPLMSHRRAHAARYAALPLAPRLAMLVADTR